MSTCNKVYKHFPHPASAKWAQTRGHAARVAGDGVETAKYHALPLLRLSPSPHSNEMQLRPLQRNNTTEVL